ncbi:MAG: sugar ABC transporter ATP-binding protein [Actinobacteria bacterium]|nr:sugar ABC transporter ATP-binding protein [Actinomycetota bacterium]
MTTISISGLRKSFGPNEVLRGLDLEIPPGEFVGLMGPNGAGKSTLLKILGGIYRADAGELRYGEERVASLAERPEVGFIHQDLGLIDDLDIVANLRLGEPPMRILGPLLDARRERKEAREAIERVGLNIAVETQVGELAPGEKALVAVARLLQRGASVLFIDEATSTLPPQDARRLISSLTATAGKGATVVMVSHKLSEILDATQRVVVILDGKIAADARSADLDRDELARMVVARETRGERPRRTRGPGQEEVLRMRAACAGRAGPVDLAVHRAEVVGLTGLAGSGLHDVAYMAAGAVSCRSGEVTVATGVRRAMVPPNRESQGGFADLSTAANMTLSALSDWRRPGRLLNGRAERRDVVEMVERLDVRPPDPEAEFGTLSGGNKQKVIFGRVLFRRPGLYILCEPTRGVDVATRADLYHLIDELREDGAGILVVTSDFEDLFAVCDRISVVESGRPGEFLSVDETTAEQLEAFI